MFNRSRMLLPVVRSCQKLSSVPARNFWRPRDIGYLMKDFEREFDKMERDFFRNINMPLRVLAPRFMPIDGLEMKQDSYRVNIDVRGFKPEDIKMSLKDGMLKIEAKSDRTAEDGSRVQQAIVREFTLPENVDASTIKSLLHENGVLSIEAALAKEAEPKEIPIEQIEGEKDERKQLKSKV